jgi:hypothetical protein
LASLGDEEGELAPIAGPRRRRLLVGIALATAVLGSLGAACYLATRPHDDHRRVDPAAASIDPSPIGLPSEVAKTESPKTASREVPRPRNLRAWNTGNFVPIDRSNHGGRPGNIADVNDIDFLAFQPWCSGTIEVTVMPQPSLCPWVLFRDGQRDENDDGDPDCVVEVASSQPGESVTFRYEVIARGKYFLSVRAKDHASSGTYKLLVSPVEAANGRPPSDSQ